MQLSQRNGLALDFTTRPVIVCSSYKSMPLCHGLCTHRCFLQPFIPCEKEGHILAVAVEAGPLSDVVDECFVPNVCETGRCELQKGQLPSFAQIV